MNTRAGTVLLIVGSALLVYTTFTFAAGWWNQFTPAAIAGVACFAWILAIDHVHDEHRRAALERERRRQMAALGARWGGRWPDHTEELGRSQKVGGGQGRPAPSRERGAGRPNRGAD